MATNSVVYYKNSVDDTVQPYKIASGQFRNREQNAVAGTRQKVTWTTGITEATVVVVQEAAGTAELRACIAIAFDAPNDATADTWLTAADSETEDSNRFIIFSNQPRTFQFTHPVTRIDMIRVYGSEALTVIVEAS
jgi:hypothetical protein